MATPRTTPTDVVCRDEERRAVLLAHPSLNGIDHVEYERVTVAPPGPDRHFLVVHFLKPLPDAPHSDPDGAYDLTNRPDRIRILGGERIVGIGVLGASLAGGALRVEVSAQGDFSDYTLIIGRELQPDGSWLHVIANLDERLSIASVNFRAGCPSDFDCRPEEVCPPAQWPEPLLDYLAKDYASFRQLLLDLVSQRNPLWIERNPADLGIALVELLAYAGDHLSYTQDAVANEAYLDTARQRVSARRHARLIDYAMHDGRNAWTWVFFEAGSDGTIPQGTLLITRITAPLRHRSSPPGSVIPAADLPEEAFDTDPALAAVRVFETAFPLAVHPENNALYLHTWGDLDCCLPRGARTAYLYSLAPLGGGLHRARLPVLHQGDYLLLEEVRGPATGLSADADPLHRYVVRLDSEPVEKSDPLYRNVLREDEDREPRLQQWRAGDDPLPLLQVTWTAEDALPEPVCLSVPDPRQGARVNVTLARGNLVLADHGRTVMEPLEPARPVPGEDEARAAFQYRLRRGPLTMQCQPEQVKYVPDPLTGRLLLQTPRRDKLECPVSAAAPAVVVEADFPTGPVQFRAVPHLLDSSPTDTHFVGEVGNDGFATLRFGRDGYGRPPVGAIRFRTTFRVGNGRRGNVGADSLRHVVRPPAPPDWPDVRSVRNPLAAVGGVDPETIEEVRQRAPAAFRARQFRAVTTDDYRQAALGIDGVAGAVAAFRWTGSWYTVVVGVDPKDPADLVTLPGGRTRLEERFAGRVHSALKRYKLAGYDLAVRAGEYVPLEIDVTICVSRDHFRGDVAEAVRRVLSSRVNPDGTLGFFHPDRFTFGQAVSLSPLYAAVQAVPGVDSVQVTRFRRFHDPRASGLEAAVLPLEEWEIARLDNDANFRERGVLRVTALGGK